MVLGGWNGCTGISGKSLAGSVEQPIKVELSGITNSTDKWVKFSDAQMYTM